MNMVTFADGWHLFWWATFGPAPLAFWLGLWLAAALLHLGCTIIWTLIVEAWKVVMR